MVQLHSEPSTVRRTKLDSTDAPVQTLKTPGVVQLEETVTLSGPLLNGNGVVEVNLKGELSEEDRRIVDKLRARDAEVRRHEQAHLAVAGQHALGGPSYTYQVGPDGQRYAIGGSVQIDLSPVPNDPDATLRKAQQLQQAALAPANPSSTDRQVAMMAGRMAQEALRNIAQEKSEAINEPGSAVNGHGDDVHRKSDKLSQLSAGTDQQGTQGNRVTRNGEVSQAAQMDKMAQSATADSRTQSTPTTPAAAAFASSMVDTGLDIYA
ncbi:hypothetical protein GC175_26225 [bacterium]|nr:hypothetical protein [bacterium]